MIPRELITAALAGDLHKFSATENEIAREIQRAVQFQHVLSNR